MQRYPKRFGQQKTIEKIGKDIETQNGTTDEDIEVEIGTAVGVGAV